MDAYILFFNIFDGINYSIRMKRLLLFSSMTVLFIGLTSLAPSAKFKYTSSEGKASIVFPYEITTSEKSGDSYRSVSTQAMNNELLFYFTYTIHESELSENEALAQVSLDSFIEGLNGKVSKQSVWTVRKQKGLQAKLSVDANGLIGEYRVVLIGQIQYQIAVVGKFEGWNQKEADSFFNSFKVKK